MRNNPTPHNLPSKIMALWTVFLLGTIFHTQLALMPLFHGLSVAESHTHEAIGLDAILWFMLIFFCIPLLAILACAFSQALLLRKLHFGITLLYTVLNLMHLVMDASIAVPSYQLALMTLLFFVGLLLNLVSYQWMKSTNRILNLINH